jgi:hypothetical protein
VTLLSRRVGFQYRPGFIRHAMATSGGLGQGRALVFRCPRVTQNSWRVDLGGSNIGRVGLER